jgi:hypothetical protein
MSPIRRVAIAAAALVALALAPTALAARNAPPSKTPSAAELALAEQTPIEQIEQLAKPLPIPDGVGSKRPEQPGGSPTVVEGALPLIGVFGPGLSLDLGAGTDGLQGQNGPWPGRFDLNPNRQVGKLYFDRQKGPGVDWRHCSATAVNSENKSVVLTAGHCVYNADPDGNGLIEGNGYWYESVQFCPGYEYGCRLGVWHSRQMFTTNSWFYGTGNPRRINYADDMAVVLVKPNQSGYLVNAVGGHGISFNQPTGLSRHALGYPAADWRFPEYNYNGEDLIYCPGRDRYDGFGHVEIACTMTGGASGGPWLINPNNQWLGTLNGVNSHKLSGPRVSSPYFGNTESDVFQYARAR